MQLSGVRGGGQREQPKPVMVIAFSQIIMVSP